MNNGLALLFIFCSGLLGAQLTKASFPEVVWALIHPVAAVKVTVISRKCNASADTAKVARLLDRYVSGGKADAFRHVYHMAAYSQKIKGRKIKKLGIAHEKGNYRQFLKAQKEEGETPDSLSSVMDLHNNEAGIALGNKNRSLSLSELNDVVIAAINKGEALIFRRDRAGHFTKCSGERLDIGDYKHQWYIPKCLVPSDHSYPD